MLQTQKTHDKNRQDALKKLQWLNQNLVECQREESSARERKDRQQRLMLRVDYPKKPKKKQEQIRKRHQDALLKEDKMSEYVAMIQTEIRTLRGELGIDD